MKIAKTNAMRQLDAAKIPYETRSYDCDGVNFDGELVARQVGLPSAQVFKTLVTRDDKGRIVVCCVPVDRKLDLKALAAASGAKSLAMTHPDELLALTGYLRGGCSPVGMKKAYPLFLDESALKWDQIAVSAGLRGLQMLLAPEDLTRLTRARVGVFVQP
jgi:Cys-tRNA(Pro)/Cys-tRNA(Cys) deacylase